MKHRLPFVVLLLTLIVLGLYFMPTLFLPKRWLDIQAGQERSIVHAVLGTPDADYAEKQFDGWHNPFFIGASVLVVRYDHSLSKVVSTRIETTWGTGHRDWVQEYKQRLSDQTDPQHGHAASAP